MTLKMWYKHTRDYKYIYLYCSFPNLRVSLEAHTKLSKVWASLHQQPLDPPLM